MATAGSINTITSYIGTRHAVLASRSRSGGLHPQGVDGQPRPLHSWRSSIRGRRLRWLGLRGCISFTSQFVRATFFGRLSCFAVQRVCVDRMRAHEMEGLGREGKRRYATYTADAVPAPDGRGACCTPITGPQNARSAVGKGETKREIVIPGFKTATCDLKSQVGLR